MSRPTSQTAACFLVVAVVALGALAERHARAHPTALPVDEPAADTDAAGPIDLNVADATSLEALPRVGPVLARRIVDDRRARGAFRGVDDLARVPGLGPASIERLRPFVVVRASPVAPRSSRGEGRASIGERGDGRATAEDDGARAVDARGRDGLHVRPAPR